jgi:ketosteroid isomerase-like protein
MYAGGSVEPVSELLAEEIVWHVPGQSLIAGDHRGHKAVLDYFIARRELAGETMRMHPKQAIADEEAVVQLVDGTAVIDGEEVGWRTVGVYRISDGKIAEVWLVPLDLDRFDRVWRSAEAA